MYDGSRFHSHFLATLHADTYIGPNGDSSTLFHVHPKNMPYRSTSNNPMLDSITPLYIPILIPIST